MATRTVINANATALPQTRGISIIIDQPQQQELHLQTKQQQPKQSKQQQQIANGQQQQQQQQQQQHRGHSSKTCISPIDAAAATYSSSTSSTTSSAYSSLGSDNSNNNNNIVINNNNNNNSHIHTTTLSTANKSNNNFSTTFIDLNRVDVDVDVGDENVEDDGQNPRTGLLRHSTRQSEVGESMLKTHNTTTLTTTTRTTTTTSFPQLLLKVAGPEWVRHNNNNNNRSSTEAKTTNTTTTTTVFAPLSERRKAKEDVARAEGGGGEGGRGGGGAGDKKAAAAAAAAAEEEAADTVGKAASDSVGERATNNTNTKTSAGVGASIGISITHGQHGHGTDERKREREADDDEVVTTTTTTTTIIECNHDRQRAPNADDDDHDNDEGDDDVVESRRRRRLRLGVGVGDGESLCRGVGAARVDGAGRGASASLSQRWPQLVATTAANSLETADCASALTESVASAEENSHVVKIKISPNASEDDEEPTETLRPATLDSRRTRLAPPTRIANEKSEKKQVTVVQLNEPRSIDVAVAIAVGVVPEVTKVTKTVAVTTGLEHEKPHWKSAVDPKMVQKPSTSSVGQNGPAAVTSGNTTVTELNVSNPSYLYYMMSSGQFSPCDTLDSGTGSDLEGSSSHGHGHCGAISGSPPPMGAAKGGVPKLELHLKSTKIRVNTGVASATVANVDGSEHQRAGSVTDSEESESSLSCDSLNSSDYLRQSSNSPTAPLVESPNAPPPPPPTSSSSSLGVPKSPLGSFLPDSLLRDIRDRKFPTNDFVAKYVDNAPLYESVDGDNDDADDNDNDDADENDNNVHVNGKSNGNGNGIEYALQEAVAHAKYVRERNCSNAGGKRASLPGKTFVLNAADGSFVDTKLNSMPRKYEADKYYDFHVNEHENFRSFGNANANGGSGSGGDIGDGCSEAGSWAEYEARRLQDDAFAGYKDIRCSSAASTIRSSKGTVRGVKNRVRNGIATFLQLQQPNGKNYKEKDLGKVVLYTTSMGIIRDTYAKCSNMKQILRTLLVKFEERDVFMSVEYQQEIKERMHSEAIKVPQLFVEGQHIGDADTVERLNESGELRQLLKPYKSIATTYTCQTCGGYRLLPCPSCNGSKKSVHRNHFTAEFVALKCMNCDEVGLVKCHNC